MKARLAQMEAEASKLREGQVLPAGRPGLVSVLWGVIGEAHKLWCGKPGVREREPCTQTRPLRSCRPRLAKSPLLLRARPLTLPRGRRWTAALCTSGRWTMGAHRRSCSCTLTRAALSTV